MSQSGPSRLAILFGAALGVSLVAVPLTAQDPDPPPESNNGTMGHALLGGVAGAYGGVVLGTMVSRLRCPRRTDCSPVPVVLATAVGITLGSYAGATDRNRAYGGMIGVGVGVLGGALVYAAWSGVAGASNVEKPDPFTGFGMAIVGGAFGAIVGTVVAGSGAGGAASSDLPAQQVIVELPLRVFF